LKQGGHACDMANLCEASPNGKTARATPTVYRTKRVAGGVADGISERKKLHEMRGGTDSQPSIRNEAQEGENQRE